MKEQKKHCNTCASSYYQEEKDLNGGKGLVRMQHCSNPHYNSPNYTNQMLGIVLVAAPHRQHSRPFAPKQNLK